MNRLPHSLSVAICGNSKSQGHFTLVERVYDQNNFPTIQPTGLKFKSEEQAERFALVWNYCLDLDNDFLKTQVEHKENQFKRAQITNQLTNG